MAPVWYQVIIWNIADLLAIGLFGTNFGDIWIKILLIVYFTNWVIVDLDYGLSPVRC